MGANHDWDVTDSTDRKRGLDPRIHHLKKKLAKLRWIAGSSGAKTGSALPPGNDTQTLFRRLHPVMANAPFAAVGITEQP